jgi:hypothetical protein
MVKQSLRQWWPLACFAIAAGFVFAAPSALSAARPPRHLAAVNVNLEDTGQTIALPVGEQLIITLPLRHYDDNYWYVARNSGGALKLEAGPDTLRRPNWTPFKGSLQVFYFQRESPGPVNLVLEQSYWSLPMVLKIVDR